MGGARKCRQGWAGAGWVGAAELRAAAGGTGSASGSGGVSAAAQVTPCRGKVTPVAERVSSEGARERGCSLASNAAALPLLLPPLPPGLWDDERGGAGGEREKKRVKGGK